MFDVLIVKWQFKLYGILNAIWFYVYRFSRLVQSNWIEPNRTEPNRSISIVKMKLRQYWKTHRICPWQFSSIYESNRLKYVRLLFGVVSLIGQQQPPILIVQSQLNWLSKFYRLFLLFVWFAAIVNIEINDKVLTEKFVLNIWLDLLRSIFFAFIVLQQLQHECFIKFIPYRAIDTTQVIAQN